MFTVTKSGKFFVVNGAIAVIAGKVANETYHRVFRTKVQAERVAAQWNATNTRALADLAEDRAVRRANADAYLAARALRTDNQLNLF